MTKPKNKHGGKDDGDNRFRKFFAEYKEEILIIFLLLILILWPLTYGII